MHHRKSPETPAAPTARKLSDILIEIAKIGFKAPFRELEPAPKAAHILMWLANQAWNREVYAHQGHLAFNAPGPIVEAMIREFLVSRADLEQQLISTNWETIIELMQVYKRRHFPEDTRRIIASGYTPRGTLRVLWE